MATLNHNNAYLEFRGVDLSGEWTGEISSETSVNTEDVTHGAGATHVMRETALIDSNVSFGVVYDLDVYEDIRPALVLGKGRLIYGPSGNTSGMPKLEGDYILTSISGPNPSVEKTKFVLELSFEQADAPIGTPEGGHKFA